MRALIWVVFQLCRCRLERRGDERLLIHPSGSWLLFAADRVWFHHPGWVCHSSAVLSVHHSDAPVEPAAAEPVPEPAVCSLP